MITTIPPIFASRYRKSKSRLPPLLLLHGELRHAAAAGDEVDQHAEERHEDDEQAPGSLASPAHVVATEDVREDIEHAHDPCEEDEELEQCEQELPVVVEHLTASSVGLVLTRRPGSDLRRSLAYATPLSIVLIRSYFAAGILIRYG